MKILLQIIKPSTQWRKRTQEHSLIGQPGSYVVPIQYYCSIIFFCLSITSVYYTYPVQVFNYFVLTLADATFKISNKQLSNYHRTLFLYTVSL